MLLDNALSNENLTAFVEAAVVVVALAIYPNPESH